MRFSHIVKIPMICFITIKFKTLFIMNCVQGQELKQNLTLSSNLHYHPGQLMDLNS